MGSNITLFILFLFFFLNFFSTKDLFTVRLYSKPQSCSSLFYLLFINPYPTNTIKSPVTQKVHPFITRDSAFNT